MMCMTTADIRVPEMRELHVVKRDTLIFRFIGIAGGNK